MRRLGGAVQRGGPSLLLGAKHTEVQLSAAAHASLAGVATTTLMPRRAISSSLQRNTYSVTCSSGSTRRTRWQAKATSGGYTGTASTTTKLQPTLASRSTRGATRICTTNASATSSSVASSQSTTKFFRSSTTKIGFTVIAGVIAGALLFIYEDGSMFIVTAEEGTKKRPKLVILGSGWGAMSLVKELDTSKYDVTIVSPRNYFLFTPLLPSVTSGTLEPKTVIEPIRKYCKRTGSSNVNYYEAACSDIDPVNKTVTCQVNTRGVAPERKEFTLPYDKLVVAVGAINNTFGTPGVEENCLFLKELSDAIAIRNRLLDCLELASLPGQSEENKRQLLNFVVVGGGPTGVECAGECVDFIKDNVEKWFPQLKPYIKITLLELLDHILSTYDAKISDYCEHHFKRANIDVRTQSRVVKVTDKAVYIKRTDTGADEVIPFGMCIWSTGVGTSPLVNSLRNKLPAELQTNRRALLTDAHLRVKGADGIYALGDCATISQELMLAKFVELFKEADENGDGVLSFAEFEKLVQNNKRKYPQLDLYGKKAMELFEEADLNKDGVLQTNEFEALLKKVDSKLKQLPATAQVARQEGIYLAHLFNEMAAGRSADDFYYRHMGSLVSLGSQSAVAEFANSLTLEGLSAWWLWRSVYLSRQYSLKNKFLVATNWIKTAIFGRDITRN